MRTRMMNAAAAAAVLCALALPEPASAGLIPGLPSVVYDPVNYASAVARYHQLYQQGRGQIRQIEYAYSQARQLQQQAQGFRVFRLSDWRSFISQARQTMGAGVALGYGSEKLAENFRRTFPRVPRVEDGVRIPNADELNNVRDAAYAAMMSTQLQAGQIDLASQTVNQLRQAITSAQTERQVAQAQAAVQAFQAEQDLVARHTMLTLVGQVASMNARQVRSDMENQVRQARQDAQWRAWERALEAATENARRRSQDADEAIRRRGGGRPRAPQRPAGPGVGIEVGGRRTPRTLPGGGEYYPPEPTWPGAGGGIGGQPELPYEPEQPSRPERPGVENPGEPAEPADPTRPSQPGGGGRTGKPRVERPEYEQ